MLVFSFLDIFRDDIKGIRVRYAEFNSIVDINKNNSEKCEKRFVFATLTRNLSGAHF